MHRNFYLTLLLSVFLPVMASSQIVKSLNNQVWESDDDFGYITPCTQAVFMVFDYVVPSGYSQVDRFEWYYGSTLVFTVTNPGQPGTPNSITLNDPNKVVSCRIYYRTASPPFSYTYQDAEPFDPVFRISTVELNTTTTSVTPGCTGGITYTTSAPNPSGQFANAQFAPANYTVSYTPPAGWTQTSISPDGHSVTFAPGGTGTQIGVTIQFPCGYTETFTKSVPPYSYPAPTFSASNNYNVCGSPATFAINSVCGAIDYTYTISGGSGGASFAGGATTLTTSSTSVQINFSSGTSVSASLSVKANYAGGISSNTISNGITYGAQYGTGLYRYNYGADLNWSPSQVNLIPLGSSVAVPFFIQPTLPPNTVSYSWSAPSPSLSYSVVGKDLYFSLGGSNPSQVQFIFTTNQGACGTMVRWINFILMYGGYRMMESSEPMLPLDPKTAARSTSIATIAPNPANNVVLVRLTNGASGVGEPLNSVKVFDMQGKLRKQYHYNGATQAELPVTDLANGIYVIEISGITQTVREKLVVQR